MERNDRAIWEQLKRIANTLEKIEAKMESKTVYIGSPIPIPDTWAIGCQKVRNEEVKDDCL